VKSLERRKLGRENERTGRRAVGRQNPWGKKEAAGYYGN